jgi:hypothetical protein
MTDTTSIPLNQLVAWDGNVRKGPVGASIEVEIENGLRLYRNTILHGGPELPPHYLAPRGIVGALHGDAPTEEFRGPALSDRRTGSS